MGQFNYWGFEDEGRTLSVSSFACLQVPPASARPHRVQPQTSHPTPQQPTSGRINNPQFISNSVNTIGENTFSFRKRIPELLVLGLFDNLDKRLADASKARFSPSTALTCNPPARTSTSPNPPAAAVACYPDDGSAPVCR